MELEDFLKNVGEKIRYIRTNSKTKITAKTLRLHSGVSVNTISNIENGKVPCRIDNLFEIAKAITEISEEKINVRDFFDFDNSSITNEKRYEAIQKSIQYISKMNEQDLHNLDKFWANETGKK